LIFYEKLKVDLTDFGDYYLNINISQHWMMYQNSKIFFWFMKEIYY